MYLEQKMWYELLGAPCISFEIISPNNWNRILLERCQLSKVFSQYKPHHHENDAPEKKFTTRKTNDILIPENRTHYGKKAFTPSSQRILQRNTGISIMEKTETPLSGISIHSRYTHNPLLTTLSPDTYSSMNCLSYFLILTHRLITTSKRLGFCAGPFPADSCYIRKNLYVLAWEKKKRNYSITAGESKKKRTLQIGKFLRVLCRKLRVMWNER